MISKSRKSRLRHRARRKLDRIIKRDGDKCSYCGTAEGLTIDHKTPLVRGGNSWITNLALACKSCNSDKGRLTHEEYLAELERRKRLVTSFISGRELKREVAPTIVMKKRRAAR